MQHPLFTTPPVTHHFCGCQIDHRPQFLQSVVSIEQVDAWCIDLMEHLKWQQDRIHLFGREHLIPRLNAWYGDQGTDFAYSGIPLKAERWTNTLTEIRRLLEEHLEVELNSVLANLYRNGLDKMGWHSDDEKQMCPKSPIVSLNFGASRKMQFKPKDQTNTDRLSLLLGHGDLVVMHPPTQEVTKHCIPMMKKVVEPRINLTFRRHHQSKL